MAASEAGAGPHTAGHSDSSSGPVSDRGGPGGSGHRRGALRRPVRRRMDRDAGAGAGAGQEQGPFYNDQQQSQQNTQKDDNIQDADFEEVK